MLSIKSAILGGLLAAHSVVAAGPFFKKVSDTEHIIGNDLWNITVGRTHGKKLFYKGLDLVKGAAGVYVSHSGGSTLSWTNASIYEQTPEYLDVVFTGALGDFHWVIQPKLAGAYQYFVNRALPVLGEFRTLTRLDNTTFPRGKNSAVDVELPPLSTILNSTNVSDETWLLPDGSYLTKYNFASFNRDETAYGVYGDKYGVWYIVHHDDYNGDHLKQELTFHRETRTGDAVLLNMIHGTHFQALSANPFEEGKIWGPWLWYLNDGSIENAESRAKKERSAYPYRWFKNEAYQSRGSVSGTLLLSDGRPASGAAVFLGDNNSELSSLDQGSYWYYTTYADDKGNFKFEKVRSGTYGLRAWANGGTIGDVTTTYKQNDVVVTKGTKTGLKRLNWKTQGRKQIWQIGELNRKATGFKFGGAPRRHALFTGCPTNLTFVPDTSPTSDWCYGQSAIGTWTVAFDIEGDVPTDSAAVLSVSLAGFSAGTSYQLAANDVVIGDLISGAPGLTNDPSLYRSANLAGEWRYFEFAIVAGVLKKGANEVTISVTKTSLWRGAIWDSIVLEWS